MAGLALMGLALVAQAIAATKEAEPLRCHGRNATIIGTEGGTRCGALQGEA